MAQVHQIGGRNRGHPVLWVIVLVGAFFGSLWEAWNRAQDIRFFRENIDRGAAAWMMIWCIVWLASAVALVPVIIRVALITRRMYRTSAASSGHCPKCGYDLRSSPDKCPECGKFVSTANERGE